MAHKRKVVDKGSLEAALPVLPGQPVLVDRKASETVEQAYERAIATDVLDEAERPKRPLDGVRVVEPDVNAPVGEWSRQVADKAAELADALNPVTKRAAAPVEKLSATAILEEEDTSGAKPKAGRTGEQAQVVLREQRRAKRRIEKGY